MLLKKLSATPKHNVNFGRKGEEAAVGFLKDKGYKILVRNYRTKLGEVDIIAQDKDTICFIEVKSRYSERFGVGSEAVQRKKQSQISKASLTYLKERNLLDKSARFDVVSIIYANGSPRLELIKDAFELDPRFTY